MPGGKYSGVRARGKSGWSAQIDGLLTLKIEAIKSTTRKDGAFAPAEPITHVIPNSSLQEDKLGSVPGAAGMVSAIGVCAACPRGAAIPK